MYCTVAIRYGVYGDMSAELLCMILVEIHSTVLQSRLGFFHHTAF